MKATITVLCVLIPMMVLALLFSSCTYIRFFNKNLETPTATVTNTPTYTETPSDTPTPEPTKRPALSLPGDGQNGSAGPGSELGSATATLRLGPEVTEVILWGFNVLDTQGWTGKVSYSARHPSEGTGCLRIETRGCKGNCQDLASVDPSRLGYYAELGRFHKITMDVYVPPETLGANSGIEFDLVTSGPASNWSVHQGYITQAGLNHLEYEIRGNELKDPWKFYLVIVAKEPLAGPIFVDKIMGKL